MKVENNLKYLVVRKVYLSAYEKKEVIKLLIFYLFIVASIERGLFCKIQTKHYWM
jgi:hypothetical protein